MIKELMVGLSILTYDVNLAGQANSVNNSVIEELINLMYNKTDLFVDYYNEYHDSIHFEGEEIVRHKVINSKEKALVIFDFDIGYTLISEDYEVFEISNDDLTFINELFNKKVVYYDSGNYYYEEGENIYLFVEDIKQDELYSGSDVLHETNFALSSTENSFQIEAGDSYIIDINAYVNNMYPGFTFYKQNKIENYYYVYQYDTSFYLESGGSEGNCVLNAMYSMMLNMGHNFYYNNFIKQTTYRNYLNTITSDILYNLVEDGTHTVNNRSRVGKDWNGAKALEKFPELYYIFRDIAIREYDYHPSRGMYIDSICYILDDVGPQFDYNPYFLPTSNDQTIAELIDLGVPSVISTSDSIIYNAHAMAVVGYASFYKTTGWWIFSDTEYKYFYIVDDGHTNHKEYKDTGYYFDQYVCGASFIHAVPSHLVFSNC